MDQDGVKFSITVAVSSSLSKQQMLTELRGMELKMERKANKELDCEDERKEEFQQTAEKEAIVA